MSVPFSARGNQGCLQEPGLNVAWCKTTPLASQHASCMLEGYGSALKGNEQRGLVITATVHFAAWSYGRSAHVDTRYARFSGPCVCTSRPFLTPPASELCKRARFGNHPYAQHTPSSTWQPDRKIIATHLCSHVVLETRVRFKVDDFATLVTAPAFVHAPSAPSSSGLCGCWAARRLTRW